VKSLDPRVNRLPHTGEHGKILAKAPYDQFGTFEVFVQSREGKPFQHEGAVHAPNLEMAYVLAKEAFTRRFTCISLYVADTRNVYVSAMTEGNANVYDLISEAQQIETGNQIHYEIYHLVKRGKQHVHAGTVEAGSPEEAMQVARQKLNTGKPVCNIWTIRSADIRFTKPDETDLWLTLPEKKFRDASDYKGGDKLKTFLEKES
jgi:ring-1,2-phenylacetyl-CoA epoxidase subunit PaaB